MSLIRKNNANYPWYNERMKYNSTIDYNKDWNYPLQYINECEFVRKDYHQAMRAVDKAMKGESVKNLMAEEFKQAAAKEHDYAKRSVIEELCRQVVSSQDDTLRKAVSTISTQVGVDRFEHTVYDKYAVLSPDLNDKLSAFDKQVYINNKLDIKTPTFVNDLVKYGMAAAYVSYDKKNNKTSVVRVNPKNVGWDIKYSSTGKERYRYFGKMISWAKLKKMLDNDTVRSNYEVPDSSVLDSRGNIKAKSKLTSKKLTTINDLDIYVDNINNLATNPDLLSTPTDLLDEYSHTLKNCYNLDYYRSLASPENRVQSGYEGDDVELITLFDLENNIEFKIINRKYVISMNRDSYRRKLKMSATLPNGAVREFTRDIKLDCPLVFAFYESEFSDTMDHPYSLVMHFMPYHDRIIYNRSKMLTIMNILSKLRFEADAGDADAVSGSLLAFGEIFTDTQGTISTLNFSYDYQPLQVQISSDTSAIINGMSAYSQYDMMQVVGDRASAKEAGMADSAIAQGVAQFNLVLRNLLAEIARISNLSYAIYSDDDTVDINNNGSYDTVSLGSLAYTALINVVTTSERQISELRRSNSALQLYALMAQDPVVKPEARPYMWNIILGDLMPRAVASKFIKSEAELMAEQAAQQQAEAAQLAQAQAAQAQAAAKDPVGTEAANAAEQLSPEQQAALTEMLNSGADYTEQGQDAGISLASGSTPEMAGELGNPNAQ